MYPKNRLDSFYVSTVKKVQEEFVAAALDEIHKSWLEHGPEFLKTIGEDPNDEFLWARKLTEEELEAYERWMKCDPYAKHIDPKSWTCDDCLSRRRCNLAWNTYNTRGDCLAEK